MIIRFFWLHFSIIISFRFRVDVRVKCRFGQCVIPRPKTNTGYLMRIGFLGYPIGKIWNTSRMFWSLLSGEAGYCQVEAAPEKMNGAAFAFEITLKLGKNILYP